MNSSKISPRETDHFNSERAVSNRREMMAFCLDLYAGTLSYDNMPAGLERLRVYRDGLPVYTGNSTDRNIEPVEELPGLDGEGIFRRRISSPNGAHVGGSFVAARLGRDFNGKEISAVIKSAHGSLAGPLDDNRDHLVLGEIKRLFAALAASKTIGRVLEDKTCSHCLVDENSETIWSTLPNNAIESTLGGDTGRLPDNMKVAHLNLLDRPCRLISIAEAVDKPSTEIKLEILLVERLVHKLKGKLGAIMTASDQLINNGDTMSADDSAQMMGIISRASDQIELIINRFEEYINLPDPNPKNIDLATWLKNLIAIKAGENSPIRTAIKPDGLFVTTDETLLRRAVAELVDNALEVGFDSEPATVALDCDGDHASITITNALPAKSNGGLTLSDKVAEPFLSTKSDRAGLGFTLAEEAISRLGGRLELEFTDKNKLTARLILPININGDK